LIVGVVCLASLGGGVLAYRGGSDIEQGMREVDGLVNKVRQLQSSPANRQTIEAKRIEQEARQVEFEESMSTALATQRYSAFHERLDEDGNIVQVLRQPLVADALPKAKSAVRIEFKGAYKREFGNLYRHLRARGGPTQDEMLQQEIQIAKLKRGSAEGGGWQIFRPSPAPRDTGGASPKRALGLMGLLRESPQARAADQVARSVYMYAEEGAFGIHDLAMNKTAPAPVEIWQAQMSLWIQQDIAAALAWCNEKRVEELREQKVEEPFWVAQMPVKHLRELSIEDALGNGGGSNHRGRGFAVSFTGTKNNNKMFMVPLRLDLVIEEAALMSVLEELCGVGFYTVVAVNTRAVDPDPTFLQRVYVYGQDPVLQVVIDLEGCYFREVFEEWIPKELKNVLKKPGANEDLNL
jgi:hypothetical protein